MSDSRVQEYFCRMAEDKIEVTMLAAFLRTFRSGVISRLPPDDTAPVCGEGGVFICVAQKIV